jgi:hypothetical protein
MPAFGPAERPLEVIEVALGPAIGEKENRT